MEIFSQKNSHSAEKCKRRTFLDLLTYISLQNIKKLEGETPWGHIKNFAKCRAMPKKIQRRHPLGTSGFVGFLDKLKNERGPFGIKLPWRDLALGGFRIVSKK